MIKCRSVFKHIGIGLNSSNKECKELTKVSCKQLLCGISRADIKLGIKFSCEVPEALGHV